MSILRPLHLSPREEALYLACLEHGPDTIAALARAAGQRRSTAAYVIRELLKRSLAVQTRKGRRSLYDAAPPQKLLAMARSEERELERLLPQLEQRRRKRVPASSISVHEDADGLKEVYRELYALIAAGERALFLSSIEDLQRHAPFAGALHAQSLRELKHYHIRELLRDVPAARKWVRWLREQKFKHPCRLLPASFSIVDDLALCGDLVALFSFRKRLSVTVIRDAGTADTLRALYECAWENGIER